MIRVLADVDAAGNWTPGLGDNTVFGWLITAGYLVAVVLCVRAWRLEDDWWRRGARGLRPRFWLAMTAAMLLLGLNKQLDLQTLVSFLGRRVTQSMGWYGERRAIQIVFIALVGLMMIGVFAGMTWWIRTAWRRYWPAAAGATCLGFFVLLRAASFHHIDTILYRLPVVGLSVNRGVELGGILIVSWCAWRIAHAEPGGASPPSAST